MSNNALNIRASTQKFTEIQDISENIVLLTGNNACLIVQITATNFSLLSKEEQDARVFSYASLLNSLSFQIQILIRSKNVELTPYLKLLEAEAQKTTNPKLKIFITQYKEFVENIVKQSTVLDKQFYIVLPYSFLETGTPTSALSSLGKSKTKNEQDLDEFFHQAKGALHGKAESLMAQLDRLGLRARMLEREDLTKLFYDIYNQDNTAIEGDPQEFMKTMFVEEKKT